MKIPNLKVCKSTFKYLNVDAPSSMHYHSGKFIWANPKISSSFSPIFPSFGHLVPIKPMANWSRTPGQLSGGHRVEQRAEFWFFFFQIFKVLQIFRHFIGFKFSAKSSRAGSFSYQFNDIQSTFSPILKFGLYLAHLFSPSQPLCYGRLILDQDNLFRTFHEWKIGPSSNISVFT